MAHVAVEPPLPALVPSGKCHTAPEAAAQHMAHAAVEPPVPALVPSHTSPRAQHGSSDLQEISLLVEVSGDSSCTDSRRVDTIAVLGYHTIASIKMRLKMKGWFSARHALVLGDRELLGHETVAQLARSEGVQVASPAFLHVFIRAADVQAASISSKDGLHFSFGDVQPPACSNVPSPRSALTASLAESRMEAAGSVVVRGLLLDDATPIDKAIQPRSDAVIHLVVRRTATVGWSQQGLEFELSIRASDTVDTVKQQVEAQQGLCAKSHHLLLNGRPLAPSKSLADYGIGKGTVLELAPFSSTHPAPAVPGSPPLSSPDHRLFGDFQAACAGLAQGRAPKLAPAGSGGSYFIPGVDGRHVAVFKPADEEPYAANNPKGSPPSGYSGDGLRKGIRPGEGAAREVAAFLLDHGGFAGVPPTALVSCHTRHGLANALGAQEVKVGSLQGHACGVARAKACAPLKQAFVDAEGDCEERGCSAFPVEQVHKIAVLDIRLANTDRNAGNILARKGAGGAWELIPIDHGYCLPSSFQDVSFEWLYWPQAREPFSAATRAYIEQLDAEADLALLAANGIHLRPPCQAVFRTCTMLLQKAAQQGCSPLTVGEIMCRETQRMSPLEKLHSRAMSLAQVDLGAACTAACKSPDSAAYMRHMSQLLDELLVSG